MIGYKKVLQIMSALVAIYLTLGLVVLRDSPYPLLRQILNIAFLVSAGVLFVLLLLNRYRP